MHLGPITKSQPVMDDQVIIQDCFPPEYTYLGEHTFQNVQQTGPGVKVFMAQTPKGETFQRNSLKEIVAAAWRSALVRAKV